MQNKTVRDGTQNNLATELVRQNKCCYPIYLKSREYQFLPASPKAEAGLGVGSVRPPQKACHRNSSETTEPKPPILGK